MEEQRPDGFSSNGIYPEAAIGIPEAVDAEAQDPDGEATSLETPAEAVSAGDPTDEPAGDAEKAVHDETAADDGTAFLAQLAGAMRATAATERKRVDEDTDRRREEHLETIRGRRASEADKMRELAAEDLKGIDEWAAGERQRIDQEREQRAAALQDDLEKSLAEHGTQIEGEIQAVEGAIAGYRTEVDTFFAQLDAETDPVEIARLAARRPVFPDLAAVSASAQAATPSTADAAQAPVGVMDSETAADPAAAWSRWNATTTPAGATGSPVTEESPTEAAVAPSSLLQSVAVSRPYANLIGDSTDDR